MGDSASGLVDRTASHFGVMADGRFAAVLLLTFSGIFTINLVPPTLPAIADTFAVSEAGIGWVMTAFTLPAIVMIPAMGAMADLYGRRRVVLVSLLVFGAAGVATPFVGTFEQLLVLRVLQGIGFSGTTPLGITLVGDLYSGPRGSTAQGILASSNGLGNIFAPAAAGALVAFAWYYPYLLFAVAFPTMAVVYVYLSGLPARDAAPDASVVGELRSYWRSIRRELNDPDLGLLYAGATVEYFVKYGVLTFVPLFAVQVVGASLFEVGLVLSSYGVVKVLVAPTSGLAIAASSRKAMLLVATGLVAASMPMIAAAPSVSWLAMAVVIYSVGDALLAPLLNDAVASSTDPARRGGVVSALNMFKNVGKTLSPVVLGVLLAATGFTALWLLTAGLIAGYGVLVKVATPLQA